MQRGIVLGLIAEEAAVVIEIAAIFGFQCVSCGGIKGAFDQPTVAGVGYGCVRQQRGRAEVCGQIVRHQFVKISIVRKITLCGFAVQRVGVDSVVVILGNRGRLLLAGGGAVENNLKIAVEQVVAIQLVFVAVAGSDD